MSESANARQPDEPAPDCTAEPVPTARFQDACRAAGVPAEDRETLWRLHRNYVGQPDEAKRLAGTFEDYGHWVLYVRSRRGDARAAGEFESYWSEQARTFFRLRFSQVDADELTGIFFERVYRLVGEDYAWRMPFTVYLRTILLNLGHDHVGRLVKLRERETPLDTETQPEVAAATTEDLSPEEATLASERMQGLRRALWELSPRDRQVLIALTLKEQPADELAKELGITRNTVYQRLHRARGRLKKVFEERGLSSE